MPEFTGINAATGKALSGTDHLKQSIRDILTTRIGSRVMRREYGSRLPDLVDEPFGEALTLELAAATGIALERWEPRFRLGRVQLQEASEDGRLVLALEGTVLLDGQQIRLEGIEIN